MGRWSQADAERSQSSMMMSSAEIPKVKVVPSFLEHDLEGFVFPR